MITTHLCECGSVAAAYERLTALYHDLLGRTSLAEVFERAASAVGELVPCSSLLIAEADRSEGVIVPLLAKGSWEEETLRMRPGFSEGLIGWTVTNARPVLANEAHRDPRAGHIIGTPAGEPEAIICLPLIAEGVVVGALSLYREGDGNTFTETEFAIARHFADAIALALTHARNRVQLQVEANTDHLTGCLNRRGFTYQLDEAVTAARGEDELVALILVDLDQFKRVNDDLGHCAGDLVLRYVADQLRAAVPSGVAVSRLGGDEFAVILTPRSRADLEQTVAEVEIAMRRISFLSPAGSVTVSGSVGVSVVDAAYPGLADHLLRVADEAMYVQKHTARSFIPLADLRDQVEVLGAGPADPAEALERIAAVTH
jgi:diguanylate cyclase (GGDEF)-like protein